MKIKITKKTSKGVKLDVGDDFLSAAAQIVEKLKDRVIIEQVNIYLTLKTLEGNTVVLYDQFKTEIQEFAFKAGVLCVKDDGERLRKASSVGRFNRTESPAQMLHFMKKIDADPVNLNVIHMPLTEAEQQKIIAYEEKEALEERRLQKWRETRERQEQKKEAARLKYRAKKLAEQNLSHITAAPSPGEESDDRKGSTPQ